MPTASLTGSAGVYFVASRLNVLGYHVAITLGSVPNVDLLVSSIDGSASLSVQVKTTCWAMRTRGRGAAKVPDHYEWDIGWACARLNRDDLLFALVDLREYEELPDIFFVPSKVIAGYFAAGPEGWPRARYHEQVTVLEQYKNNWTILERRLRMERPDAQR